MAVLIRNPHAGEVNERTGYMLHLNMSLPSFALSHVLMWYYLNGLWKLESGDKWCKQMPSMLKAKEGNFFIIIFVFLKWKLGWESSNACFQVRAWQKWQILVSPRHSLTLLICSHLISKAVLNLAKAALGVLQGEKHCCCRNQSWWMTVHHFPAHFSIAALGTLLGCKTEVLSSASKASLFTCIVYSLWSELYSSLGYCVLPIIGAMGLNIFLYFPAKPYRTTILFSASPDALP